MKRYWSRSSSRGRRVPRGVKRKMSKYAIRPPGTRSIKYNPALRVLK